MHCWITPPPHPIHLLALRPANYLTIPPPPREFNCSHPLPPPAAPAQVDMHPWGEEGSSGTAGGMAGAVGAVAGSGVPDAAAGWGTETSGTLGEDGGGRDRTGTADRPRTSYPTRLTPSRRLPRLGPARRAERWSVPMVTFPLTTARQAGPPLHHFLHVPPGRLPEVRARHRLAARQPCCPHLDANRQCLPFVSCSGLPGLHSDKVYQTV